MARIRTTKPEFYTSEQVMNLSIPARFAFQGLWTFCDDGGNHPASAKTLKAEVFPSDDLTSVEIQALVDEMLEQGLLALYESNGKQFWHVTGWHHQRIDKPSYKHPKFEESGSTPQRTIEEQAPSIPGGLDEDSHSPLRSFHPGVEGIGVESKGVEGTGVEEFRLGADAPPSVRASKPSKPGPAEQEKPKTRDTWEAYKAAYTERYGEAPVGNAKVNSQLSQLLSRIPVDEAPSVAEFYVRSNNQFYVAKGHVVGVLLADAEKLRTEWKTGRQGTSTQAQARLADRAQSNFNAFAPLIAQKQDRHHGFDQRDYGKDGDVIPA